MVEAELRRFPLNVPTNQQAKRRRRLFQSHAATDRAWHVVVPRPLVDVPHVLRVPARVGVEGHHRLKKRIKRIRITITRKLKNVETKSLASKKRLEVYGGVGENSSEHTRFRTKVHLV